MLHDGLAALRRQARQHSGRHRTAVAEINARYGIFADYAALAEADKIRVLTGEIQNLRPFTAQLHFSQETNETIGLFRLIRRAQQEVDSDAIQTYIISMTTAVSNVLEVLIGRLRRKLDPAGTLAPIETLRGRGYRFTLA